MTYRLTRLRGRKQEIQLEGEEMKPLPLLVVTIAVSACASQPMPPSAQGWPNRTRHVGGCGMRPHNDVGGVVP
jgi:hypothetical protein